MSKILSQEEIDALLENVGQDDGKTTHEVIGGNEKKVTPYDFSHPQLLSKEQERMIENIHENFCRSYSVYLSAQLRLLAEIRQLSIEQYSYSEFVTSVSNPSCLYIMDFDRPSGRGILEMSSKLNIFIVEKLFGGQTLFKDMTEEREITHIEQKVMKRVMDKCFLELTKSWLSENDIVLKYGSFESNPEYAQVVSSSEPVVVVTLEVVIHGTKTLMNICYPYNWLSKVMFKEEFQAQMNDQKVETSLEDQESVEEILMDTKSNFSAVLGKINLSIKEILELGSGDVLVLPTKINSPISIYFGNKHVFDGNPGSHRRSKAVKITKVH
jgi:flagellar motor switch protein FliM